MKKFLSLVLALVMTMSLVTVSAGAKDFTDNGDITYDEAVAVMSAVEVIDGYTDGSFQPTTNLTRGAAAKIICNLILGPTTAAALGADTAPYSDVPVTNNFAGYIAYCQKEKIISGYADGTFRPGAPLTGYAFMKMLLGALGYDSAKEGYTGPNWSVNVAKQAIAIGLDDGNDDFVGQASVNREEAMLYAFNTMEATMVEYPNDTSVIVGDITVSQSGKASKVENNTKTDGNIDDDGHMQFAEEYFSKLVKDGDTDSFGRPAHTWKYDGDKVGTYANDADATYTVEDAKKELSVLVTDSDYLDYAEKDVLNSAEVYRNGEKLGEYSKLDDDDKLAGKGDIIEAYENDDNKVDTIVIRSYTYAKIDELDKDLSSSLKNKGASVGMDLIDIDGKDLGTYYDAHDDDDKVLNGYDSTYEDGTVLAIAISAVDNDTILDSYVAESVEGTPSAARKVEKTASYNVTAGDITIGGTKYAYAAQMTGIEDGENVDFDEEYTVYLTAEGYVLAIDGASFATLKDVYYVTGVYSNTTRGKVTYYAQAVAVTDGAVSELKLDVDGSGKAGDLNGLTGELIFKDAQAGLYIMDEDDGKYTATEYIGQDGYTVVEDTLSTSVDSASTVIRFTATSDNAANDDETYEINRLYLDDTTFFVGVEDESEDISVKTATGVMSVDKDSNGLKVYAIYKDGKNDAVFVVYAADKLSGAVNKDDVVYLTDDAKTSVKDGYEVELYFMKNMESENVVIDSDEDQGFYTYTVDSDDVYELKTSSGYALTSGEVKNGDEGYAAGVVFDSAKNSTVSGDNGTAEFVATSAADAVVIDTRSGSDKKADLYSNDITTVSKLVAAIGKGDVTADVYVEDGDIVFVAVTACENDGDLVDDPAVDAADYKVKFSGNTVDEVLVYADVLDESRDIDVRNMVIAAIEAEENSTVEKITSSGTTYTFVLANRNDYTWDYNTVAAKAAVKVSVDGVESLMDATTTLNGLNTSGTDANATWIKVGNGYKELSADGGDKIADNATYETGFYKVTAPADVSVNGNAGAYTATVNKEYAKDGETVEVTVTTKTAATTGTDTITLTGVTGGNAAVGQEAAKAGESIVFTYEVDAADSRAVISVANA